MRAASDRQKKEPPITIVLIDDHELARKGLCALLRIEPDLLVLGEARTVTEGVAVVERLAPQMVLLDVKFRDTTVAESCRQLLAVAPKVRILVIMSCGEDATVTTALRNGAHGCILKDVRVADLLQAIRTVAAGEGYLDPRVAQQAPHWLRTKSQLKATADGRAQLSSQERAILPLLAEGKTNKEIAVQLGLSDKTVKNYLANIFDKLQVKRRTEAAYRFLTETHLHGNESSLSHQKVLTHKSWTGS